ncbi:MAG: protein-disulfide reductase DsbD domain-containing protein, partial [Pyrinomonadaceae bacterium]
MSKVVLKILFTTILLSMSVFAQNPAKWSLSSDVKDESLKLSETIKAELEADIEPGWHLYALEQPEGGPVATTIKITDGKPFEIAGKITSPKPAEKTDPLFTGLDGKPLQTKFFTSGVTFTVPLKTTADVRKDELALDVRFQLCNDTVCL